MSATNEELERCKSSPSNSDTSRSPCYFASSVWWKLKAAKLRVFYGCLVLTAATTILLYQYGNFATFSIRFAAEKATTTTTRSVPLNFSSSVRFRSKLTEWPSWVSSCGNDSSTPQRRNTSDLEVLLQLKSSDCCTQFSNLQMIGDARDAQHTYHYPASELDFDRSDLQTGCDSTTELFIAIKSASNYGAQREILRQTYLSPDKSCDYHSSASETFCREAWRRTKYAFFVSLPAEKPAIDQVYREIETFGDIVLISLRESYRNLTLKTTGSLYWTLSRCPKVKYIISTDDDMLLSIVNVWRVILALETNTPVLQALDGSRQFDFSERFRNFSKNLLGGKLACDEPVRRDGKYGILQSAYAQSKYPDFLKGWFVLLSSDVAQRLVSATMCIRLLWLDDVFLFGILAHALRMSRSVIPGLVGSWERPSDFSTLSCNNIVGAMFSSSKEANDLWKKCTS